VLVTRPDIGNNTVISMGPALFGKKLLFCFPPAAIEFKRDIHAFAAIVTTIAMELHPTSRK